MPSTPSKRSLCVFLLAMSVLSLEVALTRIFSFITFHHFTYLVISMAMLGFGAAGTYLTKQNPNIEPAGSEEFLSRNVGFLGLTIVAAVVLIPRIPFNPMDMYLHKYYGNLISFLLIVLLAGAPFYFGGICIGYIISNAGEAVNQVYFADLAGAATGCIFVLFLINHIGAIAACFFVAAGALMVAFILSPLKRWHYLIGALSALALTLLIMLTEALPLYAPPGKQMFQKEHLVELVKWHVITRLDITKPIKDYYSFGGALSRLYRGDPQNVRLIYQDASNLTGIIQPTSTLRESAFLGYYLQGAPYVNKPQADALVIGCGGGVDILIGLYYNVRSVIGVDVNPHTIHLIKDRYRDFAGNVYNRPDVDLIVAEGRYFLSRDQRKFDVIQLSGVDTWAAVHTGANALTESFIYTSEAFDQYLGHLKEDGVVNFSRPFLQPPVEMLKLAATALSSLDRRDAKQPLKHLVILKGQGKNSSMPWAQVMVKCSPFTPAEVKSLTNWATSLGFEVIYDPFTPRKGDIETLIQGTREERRRFIAEYPLNIAPATDDKPFFFQFFNWHNLLKGTFAGISLAEVILLNSLTLVIVLSGVCILLPLYQRKAAASRTGGRAGIFSYFASLGLGFIIVEITLLQKFLVFLGGPAYSMAITLCTILLFSGLGSFLSRKWARHPFRLLAMVMPLLVAVIIAAVYLLDPIIASSAALPHFQRILMAVGLMAPLGLLMGMPFPAGLRFVDQFRPELNPWAWGINACTTVIGTVVCILITSILGFRLALLAGACCYFTGWLIFTVSERHLRGSTTSHRVT